jgi:DAK2 domain fusion protein YloV
MNDRERLLALVRGALGAIEQSRARIDDLNVYPVPDGDTGTNLALTVRAVVEAVEASEALDRQTLARETSRAALMGARGNSGVILSQIVRGAAEAFAEPGAVDSDTIARALRGGSDAAYRAVREPVEGTMLTAIRGLAEIAEREPERPLAELLHELVARGEEIVARTPDQLEVLRAAGVVDAGAAGLVELVRGLAAAAAGEALPPLRALEQPAADTAHQELSRYRYCTTFVIEGELDPGTIEERLEPLGDSLLVVGDASAVKAHVHTDDPGAALSIGTAVGTIANIEIADMHRQTEARERRLLAAVPDATGVVAVVAGDGNRRVYESLGAAVVEGGQSMNPSAAELVAAIDASTAREVLVLPNNDNVVLAAEQARGLASKAAFVVPTTSIQAGLAALVAFEPAVPAEQNARQMVDAAAQVATGAVTRASRDVQLNGRGVAEGEYLGLVDGEPFVGGSEFAAVARAVVEQLLAEPRGVLTLLAGADGPDLAGLVAELETSNPELEIELHDGGQPHYALLVAAE